MEDKTLQKSLNTLKPGESGNIKELHLPKDIKRRLEDMGMVQGAKVECVYKSPLNDPVAYQIRGAVIAIRNEDSNKIFVETNPGRHEDGIR